MLFNSFNFLFFFPVVFTIYWLLANRSLAIQNKFVLFSSYFFYASWNWKFLFLLIFSTLLDYFLGIKIHETKDLRKRKAWLWLSISVNLGFLGVFKYYNFFVDSFIDLFKLLGSDLNLTLMNLILPVGISFYTFHGLSYVIDIYNDKLKPIRDFTVYALFVSFFPLLVAGPIERASHLLPQLLVKREFNYARAVDGARQILWGLFKKIVIADNCAQFANLMFNDTFNYSGSALALGALFFTFQIYCDFSGYSDIASGVARLLGIELLKNFSFPYFSRNMAEFWRRWHISLSSWFKDYVYIPLGGSKGSLWLKVRNTFIIFILSGFWHGANWTYIVWGVLNAIFILPSLVGDRKKTTEIVAKGKLLPTANELISVGFTFLLSIFAWIFFRAKNVWHAYDYISIIFSSSFFTFPAFEGMKMALITLILTGVFVLVEWVGREGNYALEKVDQIKIRPMRWMVYIIILFCIFLFTGKEQQFVYFQF
jgi:alginate O-acetyltransferase complex protein AlgI